MAYTRFQHDVFLSYAVKDNEGPYRDKRGWVQAFEEQLKAELNREVTHQGEIDIFLDRKRLACGDPFDEEIRTALDSTAVLVVLLSKRYLASKWCKLEREAFLRAIGQQRDLDRRVFVVELTDLQRLTAELPSVFTKNHRVRMWEHHDAVPRRFGHPVPDQAKLEHQSFFNGTLDVAYAIAERLDEFAATAEAAPTAAIVAPPTGPAIYLAPPPKGTDEERFARDLRTKLENSIPPLRVVPEPSIPKSPAEATAFVQSQLRDARLFVQVVGYNPGTTPAGFDLPLPRFQQQLAEEAKLPRLIWRLPDIAPAEIDDLPHRQWVEQALAGDVEDCRRAILDRLQELDQQQAAATSPRPAAAPGETLFVNHLPDDEKLAREVCRVLTQQHFVCVKRSFDGATEDELRLDFEQNLRACDKLLMVHGQAAKTAAKAQLLECLKVSGQRQATDRAIGGWFVVFGPPPKDNPTLDLYFEGLHEIDGSQDLHASLTRAFAEHRPGGRP